MRPAKVSVIVVTLDAVDLLRNCLRSLVKQTYPELEIIVVDNGSSVDITSVIADEFPSLSVLRLEQNRGFAGGNNAGIAVATGDYVALLNNDAVADPDWVSEMVRRMEDPGVGAVASVVVDGNNPAVLDSCGIAIAIDGMSKQFLQGAAVEGFSCPEEVLGVSGCACLLRKKALDQVGLLDESFFAYCEDTDLSLRLRRGGWSVVAAPGARVIHYYSQTTGAFSLNKIFWVERNHFWVVVKSFPLYLVLLLPFFTLWRFVILLDVSLRGGGNVNAFISEAGMLRVLGTMQKAHGSMLLGLPRALACRFAVKSPAQSLHGVLRRFRLSIRDVVTGRTDPARAQQ